MRSQRYLYEKEKKRPIQMQAYIQFQSLLHVILVCFLGAIFGVLTKFEYGRKLLLNHPKFFSLGFFSHEGPKPEVMENTKFSITFYGEGWPVEEKLAEPTDKHTSPPTKKIVTKVTGSNPGYGATCVAVLLSAVTVLKETNKLPNNGGVIAPGAAFRNTNLISNLCKNGYTFEIISAKEESKADE